VQPATKTNTLVIPTPQVEPEKENNFPKLLVKLPLSVIQPVEDIPDKK
jgi:hypothetical protein